MTHEGSSASRPKNQQQVRCHSSSPGTQIYKLVGYGEASTTMLARSTPEQSPMVQLSVSSHHSTPAEGSSAPVSPAKSRIPMPPAPSSPTKCVTPAQTAPGSLARSIMPEVPAPGSPSKSGMPILTVTRTPTSCKHFSSDMAQFWQAKGKQQDLAHRICQELETQPHARKKISCHPTTPQTIELAKGKGCLLSFFATDTTKVMMVTTELRSPPKVCQVTSPSLKGKPLGSPVQTQTSPHQPSGSTTSLGSTVVVSATTEQQQFNAAMSPLRTAVEWGFAKLATYFAFVNFYANLKIRLQPIGHYFQTAMLLTNCHTCCYGSEVGTYFNMDPPPLDVYLQ